MSWLLGGGLLGWIFAAAVILFIVAWPYLLGTYIAVQLGAWDPSTERFVVGWIFEVLYVAGLVAWFVRAQAKGAQRAAEQARRMAGVIASGAVYEAKSGGSVVYRHGTCAVNHRSHHTAASCRKSSRVAIGEVEDAPPVSDRSLAAGRTATRLAVNWGAAILSVGVVIGLVVLLVDPIHSAAEDAASKPCPAQTSSIGGGAANISVPDIVGQNAGDAEKRVKSRGFDSVVLRSANPHYESVIVASNWTVVSTDPAPGCLVNRRHRVVVYVTK